MRLILLTPSENDVACDAGIGVGEECEEDQIMQIYTFHQDPRVVGQEKVLPQAGERLALPIALVLEQPVILVDFDHRVSQSDAGHEEHILQ